MTAGIRDILQTHTRPTITKTAPDVVIYIDGRPYLTNEWLSPADSIINFNDYVTTASSASDIGTFIPSLSFALSVPYSLSHQFMGPGGNRVLNTMSEVKVFAKGYYLTKSGDSVYHRVFWGVITNVTYNDDKKFLNVSVTAQGILHLLDLMQINTRPSAITANEVGVGNSPTTWAKDRDSSHNPFQIIFRSFSQTLSDDIFDVSATANLQTGTNGGTLRTGFEPYGKNAFSKTYATKWNERLGNIRKGFRMSRLPQTAAKKLGLTSGPSRVKDANMVQRVTPADVMATFDNELLSQFTPNFVIADIPLRESTIVSRLAKVQEMVELIGWEGYQDVDGSIVVKPPLYNLDVTNDMTAMDRNPFVIHLDEIEEGNESEVEDATQVRLTRAVVHGRWHAILDGSESDFVPHAIYHDPELMRQFGVRQEPPKDVPYVYNPTMLYAYAASQVTQANRKWKTYTVTVPLRPEIKIGFPVFIPHKDFYAYIENSSWTYTRGGQATTTLTCSSIRTRSMIRGTKTVGTGANARQEVFYRPIPNLIMRYMKAKPSPDASNPTNPVGSAVSAPSTAATDATTRQQNQEAQDKKQTGVSTAHDTQECCWQIVRDEPFYGVPMRDLSSKDTGPTYTSAPGFFNSRRLVDNDYFYTVLQHAIPYTDHLGYMVQRPFPWGRYLKLEDALDNLTRTEDLNAILPFDEANVYTQDTTSTQQGAKINAFLMAALGTPTIHNTGDYAAALKDRNKILEQEDALKAVIDDDLTMFILKFAARTDAPAQPPSTTPTSSAAAAAAFAMSPGAAVAAGAVQPR